jgi:hypothetical protein
MVVHQSTRVHIFLRLPRLMRFANYDGIAEWGMFLVRTRDFQLSITTMLGRFHSNTLEHGIRILRLVYTVDPRSLGLRVATLHSGSFLNR